MQYSVAIPENINDQLLKHLIRADHQEDLCFALWHPSQGRSRLTALISQVILPKNGERRIHGNASFLPSFFERTIGEALAEGAGIAFLHSHPGPGWQDMSHDDINAERNLAPRVLAATNLPLVGLTIGADGAWSSRFWIKENGGFSRKWATQTRVVGLQLRTTFADHLVPPPPQQEEQIRTVSAWGLKRQQELARLRIGVVGAGSVGSIVAEALARTGISEISLIDFDVVKRHNLDRLLHSTRLDAAVFKPKVLSLARGLRKSATAKNFKINTYQWSIVEETGFRAALDCDVLFSCVDRPLPRAILNFLAFAHLIPIIDGGIRIEVSKTGEMKSADWKMSISSPERRCLECSGQYNAAMVSLEREGFLDDPEYIRGLPEDDDILKNENVFAFSANVASFEVLQMLSMIIAPSGISDAGEQMYHFVPGLFDAPRFERCKENCLYPGFIAKGDNAGIVLTGKHKIAEIEREAARQAKLKDRVKDWLLVRIDNLLD